MLPAQSMTQQPNMNNLFKVENDNLKILNHHSLLKNEEELLLNKYNFK